MSRSGYTDCAGDEWALIRWRGAVASAIRGHRGQAFLREMLAALEALPEPRLIAHDLVTEQGCCGIGAVAIQRGLDVADVDPYDREYIARMFGIAEALAAEIAFINDEVPYRIETPEERYVRVKAWAESQLIEEGASATLPKRVDIPGIYCGGDYGGGNQPIVMFKALVGDRDRAEFVGSWFDHAAQYVHSMDGFSFKGASPDPIHQIVARLLEVEFRGEDFPLPIVVPLLTSGQKSSP